MLAGAAASDQDFRRTRLAEAAEIDQGKLTTEVGVNFCRLAHRRCLHPPWIGVLLVLLFDRKRHAVLDGGEARHAPQQLPLFLPLPYLARHEVSHRRGPTPLRKQIRLRKRSERKKRRNS